jgi:NADH-quinone oxidoreductase subunit H
MLELLESILPPGIITLLIHSALPLAFIVPYALVGIWLERKVSAHMQDRLGPMRVGGWHGWAQTIADMVKLIQKEDIIPSRVDRFLFRFAPYLAFAGSYGAFAVIPWSSEYIGSNIDVGVFFALAITSLVTLSIIIAGWSSNNKWSLLGSMRTVAQIVSYEVPTVVAVLSVIIVTGTLNLMTISEMQSGSGWLGFTNWFIFHSPFVFIAFVIYFISSLAEVNRTPFDLPESESELVGGFHTEYSGMRWGIFMFAEYADMLLVSLIGTALFFGGWNSPFGDFMSGPIWGLFWFIGKGMFFIFVMMWLRWTLPRLRVDQLMDICWKYIIPIAFINLVLIALWEMIFA